MKPTISNDLPASVWLIMEFHQGHANRVTREELTTMLFGKYNDNLDRQVRDAIAELVTREFRPIVATSDGAGYFVARTLNEASHTLAELDSRVAALNARKQGIIKGLTGQSAGQASLL